MSDDGALEQEQAALTDAAAVRPPVPAELLNDSWFPFTGDVRVKELLEPVATEPPRAGEGGQGCRSCDQPDSDFIWTDASWRLRPYRPTELAGQVLLETRAHHDSFADLPAELLAELGPLIARIERAILGLGGIGRVHVARWGDGGEHFHLWFMPRPFGALQLRGSMLPMWVDFMPKLADGQARDAEERLAAALSATSG